MKLQSALILILLCDIEAIRLIRFRKVKTAALCQVLGDYIRFLKKVNEEVVIVFDEMSNHLVIDFVSAAIAENPHQMTSFSNSSRLLLNTSAIILLSSVTQLESFRLMTNVSDKFLPSHQIYIYCQGAENADLLNFVNHKARDKMTRSVYFIKETWDRIELLLVDYFVEDSCSG